jgi:hypothetical protein
MTSNMGGTEILTPLKAIFKTPLPAGFRRQICVLTDGRVRDLIHCQSVEKAK